MTPISAIIVILGIAVLYVASLFNETVCTPYMDELFHVPQAQAFCRQFPRLDRVAHDPMITTFPGTYLVSALAHALARIAAGAPLSSLGGECSIAFLRSVNAALLCAGAWLVHEILSHVRNGDVISSALVTVFPTHFFFAFLFYTDVASTVFVLGTWLALMKKRYALSGVLAGCSIMMRQTNAVWVVCLVGWDIVDGLVELDGCDGPLGPGMIARYVRENFFACLRRYGLHALSVLAFASFVVYNNGSIVIGDKKNHVPMRHWVQPFYFYAFLVLSTLPLWIQRVQRDAIVRRNPGRTLGSLLTLTTLAFFAVGRGTLVHPFILADNRHYTFYIWRRLIGASDTSRYYAVPIYAASAWLALFSCPASQPSAGDAMKTAMLTLCTAAVLIPAHLLEFRYFTVPWMLHILRKNSVLHDEGGRGPVLRKLITLGGYVTMNTVTIYVFLYQSFAWRDGSTARFMY